MYYFNNVYIGLSNSHSSMLLGTAHKQVHLSIMKMIQSTMKSTSQDGVKYKPGN